MSVNAINTPFNSEIKISTLPGFKSFPYSHLFRLSGFCIYSTAIPPDSSQLVGEKLFPIALLSFGRAGCYEMRQHTGYCCVCEAVELCTVLPPSRPRSHPGRSEAAALVPEAAVLRQHHLLLLYSSQPFFFAEWERYCCLIKNHSWTNEQPSGFSPLKKQSGYIPRQTSFSLHSARFSFFQKSITILAKK